jgi:hypothetical protein
MQLWQYSSVIHSQFTPDWSQLIWRIVILREQRSPEYRMSTPTFVAEPLERGFGLTLSNSLRRVLLSSLQGAAVTSIRIEGVLHDSAASPESARTSPVSRPSRAPHVTADVRGTPAPAHRPNMKQVRTSCRLARRPCPRHGRRARSIHFDDSLAAHVPSHGHGMPTQAETEAPSTACQGRRSGQAKPTSSTATF